VKRSLVAALGAVLWLPAGLAHANPNVAADPSAARAEARNRFGAAESYFERGLFPEALREYEIGYQLSRLPGFLINIAHCHRLMGELKKARGHYRKYLLVSPASNRRAEVEEIILDLDRALAEQAGPVARASTEVAPKPAKAPSVRWWVWSAVAASVVGSTVATLSLAQAEEGATAGSESAAAR
jgi:tetratricopeptide (TPR) repeat protein